MPGLKRSLHVSQMTGASNPLCTNASFFELQRPTQQQLLRKSPSSSTDALSKMKLVLKNDANKDANAVNSRRNEQWKTVRRITCDPIYAVESSKRRKLSAIVHCTDDMRSETTKESSQIDLMTKKFQDGTSGSKASVQKGAGLAYDSELFRLFSKETVLITSRS